MKKRIGALLLTLAMVAAYMPMLAVTSFADVSFTAYYACNAKQNKDKEYPVTVTLSGVEKDTYYVKKTSSTSYHEMSGSDGVYTYTGNAKDKVVYNVYTYTKKDGYKKFGNYAATVSKSHTYGELISQKDATCKEEGMAAHYECSGCKKLFDSSKVEKTAEQLKIAKAEHTYGDLIPQKDATCKEEGMQAHYECSVCNKLFDDKKHEKTAEQLKIAKADHSYGTLIAKKDATCLEEGMQAHYECSVCNKLFDDKKHEKTAEQLKIAKADHSYGTLIAKKDATCLEEGMEAHYECSVCNKLFDDKKHEKTAEQLKIAISDHAYGTLIPKEDATCLEDGMDAHYECSVCKKLFDSTKTEKTAEDLKIPAKGHTPELVDGSGEVATCTQDGYKEHYKCHDCDVIFDKVGENFVEIEDLEAWKVGDGKLAKIDHKWSSEGKLSEDGTEMLYPCEYGCGTYLHVAVDTPDDDDDEEEEKGVKTGDSNELMLYLMLGIAAMGGTTYMLKRKED